MGLGEHCLQLDELVLDEREPEDDDLPQVACQERRALQMGVPLGA
jgi:hypothetical protein